MKQYISECQLRVVGKGWEVRRELNRLAAAAVGKGLLSAYTRTVPPIRLTIGSSSRALSDSTMLMLSLNEPTSEKPS